MNRRLIARSLTLAAALLLTAATAAAQTPSPLVGTWRVTAIVNTAPDGTVTRPYGDHPTGSMIADDKGHFMLMLLDPAVPKFAANNRVRGTPEENAAAVRGSLAYFGTYALNGTTATLKLEGSTYPNWTGTSLTFSIRSMTPETLTWAVAAAIGGETQTEWKRVE